MKIYTLYRNSVLYDNCIFDFSDIKNPRIILEKYNEHTLFIPLRNYPLKKGELLWKLEY